MLINNSKVKDYRVKVLLVLVLLLGLYQVLSIQKEPFVLFFAAVALSYWYGTWSEHKKIETTLHFSQNIFTNLVSNISGVIYQYQEHPNGTIIFKYISHNCLNLYEIEPLQIQQNPSLLWNMVHPDDMQAFRESLSNCLAANNEYWSHEWRIITPSGKVKWVKGVAYPQKLTNGCLLWDGIFLDVSKDKLNKFYFRHIFESNMIGMNTFSYDGTITNANQAFLDIIGYTREDFEKDGLNVQDITPSEYLAMEHSATQEIDKIGICIPYDKEYIRKDGSRISVLISAASLCDKGEAGICVVLDLSERKYLENQLNEQTTDLERANRYKNEFLALISHELRTPLNSILGFTQIIRNRDVSHNVLSVSLEAIERNARIQKQFIDDLLEISQILQGKIRLLQCPTNLVHIIEVAIRNTYAYAEKKSINLSLSIRDLDQSINLIDNFISDCNEYQTFSSNFTVCGDPNRLQKVICNLLDNAIKFTPANGNVEVQLSVEQGREIIIDGNITCSQNYVKVQVIDSGIGINSEFLPYVFELFRQADSSITRKSSGLGLGLATVRHIIEMHGGEVGVESLGEGKGSTFIIKLPLVQ